MSNDREDQIDRLGLPPRPFLYTLDQVANLVMMKEAALKTQHCYFEGRSTAVYQRTRLMCRNIAESSEKPDWRVTERELLRWMRTKGFRYYTRGYVQ